MRSADLHELIAQLEAGSPLSEPERLRRRIEALDHLDRLDSDSTADQSATRIAEMRTRLEAANAAVYAAIREQIRYGSPRDALLPWIERCTDPAESAPAGLHFDCLDELIGGVLQLREPHSEHIHPAPEMVFYQPTPARHILHMLRLCALTATDTLIDLGSGLGHVPILASLLTEARTIGIELESAYVATAHECAHNLNLRRAEFIRQDAREADLSAATVFYLYTPFTGSILEAVLHRLREQGAHRPIRICAFGPCTQRIAQEPWLKAADASTAADRIALFRARN
jgi:hypothetical protein